MREYLGNTGNRRRLVVGLRSEAQQGEGAPKPPFISMTTRFGPNPFVWEGCISIYELVCRLECAKSKYMIPPISGTIVLESLNDLRYVDNLKYQHLTLFMNVTERVEIDHRYWNLCSRALYDRTTSFKVIDETDILLHVRDGYINYDAMTLVASNTHYFTSTLGWEPSIMVTWEQVRSITYKQHYKRVWIIPSPCPSHFEDRAIETLKTMKGITHLRIDHRRICLSWFSPQDLPNLVEFLSPNCGNPLVYIEGYPKLKVLAAPSSCYKLLREKEGLKHYLYCRSEVVVPCQEMYKRSSQGFLGMIAYDD